MSIGEQHNSILILIFVFLCYEYFYFPKKYLCLKFEYHLTILNSVLHLLAFHTFIHHYFFFLEEQFQGLIITAQILFIYSTKITRNLCSTITINHVLYADLHSIKTKLFKVTCLYIATLYYN